MAQSSPQQVTQQQSIPAREESRPPTKKGAEAIFIENTKLGLIGIPKPKPPQKTDLNGQRMPQIAHVVQKPLITLMPGVTKVPLEHWEMVKDQVNVQMMLEEGILREISQVESLKAVPPDEAKKLISGIVDRAVLDEWKLTDKRKEIQKALSARIEFLDKPEPGTVKPTLKGARE